MHRYDVLYAQATQEGTLIDMPEDFRRAHSAAQERWILTRPDILARESDILQSGIHSLVEQYQAAVNQFHANITQDIAELRTLVETSREYIFPQRDEIAWLATKLENELASGQYVRVVDLRKLSEVSHAALEKAQKELDDIQKTLIKQDITALGHELSYLDSYYRFVRWNKLVYDYKALKKNFAQTFSDAFMQSSTTSQLREAFQTFSKTIDPYRTESQKLRAEAKKKRAALVEKEMKKWTDTPPPIAPLGDIYAQIYISLKQQMMYIYEDGELIMSNPITSGRNEHETVRGTFHIYAKERDHLMKSPFPEEDYELWVDYWMPFYQSYGIHDSCNSKNCWRTRFGGRDYLYGGSHGCINTPYNVVKFLFGWTRIGTTVYIQ